VLVIRGFIFSKIPMLDNEHVRYVEHHAKETHYFPKSCNVDVSAGLGAV